MRVISNDALADGGRMVKIEPQIGDDMPTSTPVLQPELDFFERRRLELFERAPGKYALIKGSELIGIFDTELEAIRVGYHKIGNEAFLVKQILEADVPLTFTSFNLGV